MFLQKKESRKKSNNFSKTKKVGLKFSYVPTQVSVKLFHQNYDMCLNVSVIVIVFKSDGEIDVETRYTFLLGTGFLSLFHRNFSVGLRRLDKNFKNAIKNWVHQFYKLRTDRKKNSVLRAKNSN